jgi:hypothetical protein
MRLAGMVVAGVALTIGIADAQARRTVLFVGNSFLYGFGSPVRFYGADTVTDLNSEGIGGVPALFKAFTAQAGIDYEVYLETRGGSGFEFHLENKLGVIGTRPWDTVVLNGQSTLDLEKHGDPTKLITTARQISDFLKSKSPNAQIYLVATWSRADLTYPASGRWYGKPIDAMARDVRAGHDRAAAGAPAIKGVIPVGEAWNRAMQGGPADPNPYDGIDSGKFSLWTYDNYHASTHGYYLEALVIFGTLTGRDPRSLGENECSGYELGLSRVDVKSLQQVAYEQLVTTKAVTPSPLILPKPVNPDRCTHGR